MKFLTDWRRPEERDDILWIEDDFKDENYPLDSDSREIWPNENINDPPDKGWGFVDFDRVEHTPEIPEYTTDLRSEDPEDVLWIDDDPPDDETISGIFSSEPATSIPFTASSSLVTLTEEVESEGILLAILIIYGHV